MRVMESDHGSKLKVEQHIILRNGWEYYLEKADSDGVAFGFVMGFENELGYVYVPEILPHAISRTNDLSELFPASGWKWVDNG